MFINYQINISFQMSITQDRNLIILDVGGKIMKTYKSTLDKVDFFKNYMARWTGTPDTIFLDLDPDIFIHILNKLRDIKYDLPDNQSVVKMCNYFGIKLENYDNGPSEIVELMDDHDNYKCYKFNSSECEIIYIILIKHNSFRSMEFMYKDKIIFRVTDESLPLYFKFENTGLMEYVYKLRKQYLQLLQNIGPLTINVNENHSRGSYNQPNFSKILCSVKYTK